MNAIDEYILGFDAPKQKIMEEIREVILKNAPQATQKISWGMPTFYLKGNLVHFAMNKAHLGFYPTPKGVELIIDRLPGYKYSKGTIQFPLDKPLPKDLIGEVVRFRVAENLSKADK